MQKSYLSALALIVLASIVSLSSCQDEDFGYTSEEVRAGVYDRNFIKYYGEIPENQSWDFSTSGLFSRLNAAADSLWNMGTRAGSDDEKPTDGGVSLSLTYTPSSFNASNFTGANTNEQKLAAKNVGAFVQSHDLIQWVKKRLQEGGQRLDGLTNKQEFNQRFSMIATEKSFQIIPVFQGIDNTTWDFHVVVDWEDAENQTHSVDRVLWSKSEGMLMIGERPDASGNSHQDYIESFTNIKDLSSLPTTKNPNPNNEVKYETTRLAADIISQTLTVSGYPHGETRARINFYLHMLSGESSDMPTSSTPSGTKKVFWSDGREVENALTSNIVVLPIQVDIPEYQDYEVVLMGCETAFNGDDDMNDIVFLLVGDKDTHKLPELTNLNEIGKRYFFEDLGSVVDWDFNDVVLDLMQVEYLDGSTHKIKQTATLKHRCGTTPFDLFLKESDDTYFPLNFSYLKDANGHIPGVNTGEAMETSQTIEIYNGPKDGAYKWREADNNVAIKVYPSLSPNKGVADAATNDGTWSEFHSRYQTGEVHNIPRVFVADQSVWWTAEGTNFPNMWATPSSAITTRPIGAKPNEFEHSSIYGIGSDRSYRYPRLEDGQFILWNTPTRFDHWEPLWLSEGFIEGLNNGYNTVNIEFGRVNTNYALLVRQNYKTQDYKSRDFTSVPDSKIVKYTVPTDNFKLDGDLYGGSIQWYLDQVTAGFSPSFGIQDEGDWTGDNGSSHVYNGNEGSWYITINKVWMTKVDPDEFDLSNINNNKFFLPLSELTKAGATSDSQKIRIVVTNPGNRNNYGIGNINDANGNQKLDWKGKDNNNTWYYEYTLAQIKEWAGSGSGINIQLWDEYSVTKIEILEAEPDPVQQDITLGTEYNFVVSKWADAAKINSSQLSGIEVGDKFIITLKDVKSGAELQVSEMAGDWSNKIVTSYNLDGSTSKEIEVTSGNIDAIKHGMGIQGHDFTLVKVELQKGSVYSYLVSAAEGDNCKSATITSNKDAVDGKYEEGSSITLKAEATDQWNYLFLGWFKDGATTATSTEESYTFSLSSTTAGTYTAKYEKKIDSYTLNYTALNFTLKTADYGVTIGQPTIESGKTYRLTLNFSGISQSSAKIKLMKINDSFGWVDQNDIDLTLNGSTGSYTVDFTTVNNVFGAHGIAIQRANGDNNSNITFVNGTIEEVTASNTDPNNPVPSGDKKTWTINQSSHTEYFEYFKFGNDGYNEFISCLQNGMTKLTINFSTNNNWVNLIYGNNWDQIKDPDCYQKTSATVDLSDKIQSIIDNGGVRIQSGDAVVSSFTLEKP